MQPLQPLVQSINPSKTLFLHIFNTHILSTPTHPPYQYINTVFHNSRKMSDAPSYLISRARASTVTRGARASTLNSANTLPPPSRSVSSSLFALSPTIDDDVLPAGEDDFDVIGNPMLSTSNRNRSGGGGGGSDEDLPGTARRSITA